MKQLVLCEICNKGIAFNRINPYIINRDIIEKLCDNCFKDSIKWI